MIFVLVPSLILFYALQLNLGFVLYWLNSLESVTNFLQPHFFQIYARDNIYLVTDMVPGT